MSRWTALFLVGMVALFSFVPSSAVQAQTKYAYGPDSQKQDGVPEGTVTTFKFTASRLYPGTEHDVWVYVPKQYDGTKPACVMVFNDGGGYQNRNGQWRVPTVFDNLIHKGEMPVTIAVFVNPGVVPAAHSNALPRFNRSVEYDSVNDIYARFLVEEILPEVGKTYKLTDDPNGRAICGASSGGIASFTAAWHRPDLFRRVVSFIGSFTDLRGGNTYPSLIRKTEVKPIRIFLQDGSNDLDIYSGSWFIGNNDVASALRFAGYDFQYVVGDGGHNGEHGGTLLPDALRFVWQGYPEPVKNTPSGRQPVMGILIPGENWTALEVGTIPTPEKRPKGMLAMVRASDKTQFGLTAKGEIVRITSNGKKSVVGGTQAGSRALCLSPDQTLLFVAPPERSGQYVWSWRVTPDGLRDGQVYHDLLTVYGKDGTGATGMVTDENGWLYVATDAGIQVLDQAGRVNGIITSPVVGKPIEGLAWDATNREFLYATVMGKVYRRKTQAKGVLPANPPVKPPAPRL